ncbi:MAG: FadR/GntR family transcriptional regulator [Spirochaetota bacterium]
MEIKPVETKRVYQVIIEQIIGLIRDDELHVGEKLPPERELAERFHVSRPSVREALRVMEVMGVLERKPGGGSIVTDLNIGHFLNMVSPIFLKRTGLAIELVELRYLLESKAAELAAENITEEGAAALRNCAEKMSVAHEEKDTEKEAQADIEFHEVVFSLTENYVLQSAAKFVTDLLEQSVRFGRKVILDGGFDSRRLLQQHIDIIEGIAGGEPKRARRAMESHMELVIDFYLNRYKPGSEDDASAEGTGDTPAEGTGDAEGGSS